MIQVRALLRDELAARLDDLARLRIAVFRDWPYLYDGDMDYERRYLRPFLDSDGALMAGAFDGDRLVGATTAAPLEDHAADFAAAFDGSGHDLSDIYYLAESVLLPAYRGHGIGHRFFDLREAKGRALGRRHAAFCAVVRPEDHPLRPAGHRPLDAFWQGRGYAKLPGVVARFAWKDLTETAESPKPLQFWMRPL